MTSLVRSTPPYNLVAILFAGLLWSGQTATAKPITIDTVPVGNVANGADTYNVSADSYACNLTWVIL